MPIRNELIISNLRAGGGGIFQDIIALPSVEFV